MADDPAFNPALIVVDVQEGFCPPSGALAVPNGRSILPTINTLLTYPFVLKIATKDWHPAGHISFASSHPGAEPFTSFATITNLENEEEKYESRLWLDHCIQGTPGAELVKDLDISKIDKILEKGQIKSVEMYSAFYPPPLLSPRGRQRVIHPTQGKGGDGCIRSRPSSRLLRRCYGGGCGERGI
ncbi:hypothetical protein GMDG_05377 [Pseudogymnoascus destructans 20631-21]|uniref:nicotinamidase n=1 Tax=Pseudogymnoascus destructans (strain ATCC MYA-4855 / 20631-21) TaxID=658429 RepID=L8FPB4_PSED2|nr:hypothetical protein GMDG_05377 [Pseudogymnoascus destructans 20631-21]